MQNLIDQLVDLRQREIVGKEFIKQAQDKLELTTEWQELQSLKISLDSIQEKLLETDTKIREMAIAQYQASGNKHPYNGVSIVINKELIYNEQTAIEWAINFARNVLRLDKRGFEKHARAVADTIPLSFVEIEEVPGVRIAKEL